MKILSKENIKKELTAVFSVEYLGSETEENNIILNIEDINKITNNKHLLVMSSFEQYCPNSAQKAIELIVLDFEENNKSLIEADGILVCFQVNSDYNIMNFVEAMEIIYSRWNDKAMLNEPDVIFGVSCDNRLKDDYVKATVFMGYSKKINASYANNYISISSI